jgi:hypothetical protein
VSVREGEIIRNDTPFVPLVGCDKAGTLAWIASRATRGVVSCLSQQVFLSLKFTACRGKGPLCNTL